MDRPIARAMWQPVDAYHALVYLDPEPREEYKQIGLKGAWMGYFASRSAALGPVPAEPVVAAFYGFHPDLVHRALPDAWGLASPAEVLAARLRGIDGSLRRRLGDFVSSPALAEAAALARDAAGACPLHGRVLFAGHSSLPWPEESHLVLWHAATLYREFRGDAHVAALLTAAIDPCESLVLHAATGGPPREWLQPNRGWSDGEWEAATGRLRGRAYLNAEGRPTEAGRTAREEVETMTDRLSLYPWQAIGEERASRLLDLMQQVTSAMGL